MLDVLRLNTIPIFTWSNIIEILGTVKFSSGSILVFKQWTSGGKLVHQPCDQLRCVGLNRSNDRHVDWIRAAADTTQHLVKFVAEHLRTTIIEQYHMKFFGPVQIPVPPRAGKEAGVARHLLPGRASSQQPQNNADVFEGGYDLFYAGRGDVNPR